MKDYLKIILAFVILAISIFWGEGGLSMAALNKTVFLLSTLFTTISLSGFIIALSVCRYKLKVTLRLMNKKFIAILSLIGIVPPLVLLPADLILMSYKFQLIILLLFFIVTYLMYLARSRK